MATFGRLGRLSRKKCPLMLVNSRKEQTSKIDLSNEKRAPGCLGCIGGEILPFAIGFIISHYRNGIPSLNSQFNGK